MAQHQASVKENQIYKAAAFVVVFSILGLWLLNLTSASAPFVSLEGESATLADGAIEVADVTASGGESIEFSPNSGANGLYNSIGHVGCSNSRDHIEGYHDLSGDNRFWGPPTMDTGAGSVGVWVTNSKGHWDIFDARYAAEGGADAIWFQMCFKAGGTDPDGMTASQQDNVSTVIDQINQRTGGSVPIYISPLNIYEEENCAGVGPYGVSNSIELADWAVAQGLALRGPVTGPLSPDLLAADQCHPNTTGHAFLGQQMVDFFD